MSAAYSNSHMLSSVGGVEQRCTTYTRLLHSFSNCVIMRAPDAPWKREAGRVRLSLLHSASRHQTRLNRGALLLTFTLLAVGGPDIYTFNLFPPPSRGCFLPVFLRASLSIRGPVPSPQKKMRVGGQRYRTCIKASALE